MSNKEEISLAEKKVLENFYGISFEELEKQGAPDLLLQGIKDNMGVDVYDNMLKEATLELENEVKIVESKTENAVGNVLDDAASRGVSPAEKKVLEDFYGMSFEELEKQGAPDLLLQGIKDNMGVDVYDNMLKKATLEIEKEAQTVAIKESTPPAPRGFKDFCPDIMKNEKTARWIEQEGDKAKVFAVKMAGLKDNPHVSPRVKEIISSPEGMIQMYNQIDVKFKDLEKTEEALYTAAIQSNSIEDLKKVETYQSYVDLMKNDARDLSPEHWEQCYGTTSEAKGRLIETLEDEALIYEKKKLALKSQAITEKGMAESTPKAQIIKEIEDQAERNAARLEQKVAVKTGTNVALKAGEAASIATSKSITGVVAKAAATNAKFDQTVDRVVATGSNKLNNSKVGKAYEKATTKVAETKVGKTVAKTTTATMKKVGTTAAGKAVGKVVAKTVGTAVGKSVLKKIPLVSAVAGTCFAIGRLKNGEWKAAGCEFLSGVAGCFPGLGTAASVAIDAGLAANDIHKATKAGTKTKPKNEPAPKNYVAKAHPKPVKQQATQDKKPVRKTTLSTEQMLVLKQNSRA